MNYIKISFNLDPLEPTREILYAELDALPVESAVDSETGVDAFIPEDQYTELSADDFSMTSAVGTVSWEVSTVKQENWNAQWEENFDPIDVGTGLHIRAPFHPSKLNEFDYEIVIEPKMSFGTGHHQTTWLMCQYLLQLPLQGKRVLDMGCGTAVLAILAKMRGADFTQGIDIEEWAAENSKENAERNGYPEIDILHGGAELLGNEKFDVVIANINRNILTRDMDKYAAVLNSGGQILLSGFYESDIPVLEEVGAKFGLKPSRIETKDRWAALIWNKD